MPRYPDRQLATSQSPSSSVGSRGTYTGSENRSSQQSSAHPGSDRPTGRPAPVPGCLPGSTRTSRPGRVRSYVLQTSRASIPPRLIPDGCVAASLPMPPALPRVASPYPSYFAARWLEGCPLARSAYRCLQHRRPTGVHVGLLAVSRDVDPLDLLRRRRRKRNDEANELEEDETGDAAVDDGRQYCCGLDEQLSRVAVEQTVGEGVDALVGEDPR